MSHIHLPDGVIPAFWWVTGYIITAVILAIAFSRTGSSEARKKIPLLGIVAALMLIGQSIPLGFIPFHLNLSVLAGIILGPWLGFVAVFITNLFLAFLGHGGITVVGLNTLVVGSEAVIGYLLFNAFRRHVPSFTIAAVVATVIALLVSVSLMVGVVTLSKVNPGLVLAEQIGHITPKKEIKPISSISIPRFVEIIAPFAVIGIVIESAVTALIIRFIIKVRPDIIGLYPTGG